MSFLAETRADDDSAIHSPYHYVPTRYVTAIFLILFSFSALLHFAQAIRYRVYWTLATAFVCGILEMIGWGARFKSSFTPDLLLPFQIQITATIIGPTPLIAGNFIILGRLIRRLGPSYSRLGPRQFTIIFTSCDLIALVVQGIGGGVASVAVSNDKDPSFGGHIMLGGIVFQMVAITAYALCASEFFYRYFTYQPIKKRELADLDSNLIPFRGLISLRLKLMTAALAFSTICLYVRAIYRTVELTDGFDGKIISTEILFNIFDGALITLAIFTLNIAHPGVLLTEEAGSPTYYYKLDHGMFYHQGTHKSLNFKKGFT